MDNTETTWINAPSSAAIWKHFLKCSNKDKEIAKCKDCQKVLKICGGSTKGLHNHRKLHSSSVCIESNSNLSDKNRGDDNVKEPLPKKCKSISDFFVPDGSNIEKHIRIARLVAVDGIPMSVLASSFDLKKLFSNAYSSANSIKASVDTVAGFVRRQIVDELDVLKRNGERFSITLDEWTSIGSRRYLNINIHGKDTVFNTGLVRIRGLCTSDICLQMIESHLKKFNISVTRDILAFVTDGASVMVKLSQNSGCLHQMCIAHAIHLCVMETFYSANIHSTEENPCTDSSNDSSEETDDKGDFDIVNEVSAQLLTNEIFYLIIKCRKVVKFFRRSPKNTDTLQKHAKGAILSLDVKTRWNSMLTMLQSIVKHVHGINLSINEIQFSCKSAPATFSTSEITQIKEVIQILQPLCFTIMEIQKRSITVLECDAIIELLLDELSNMEGSELCSKLLAAIRLRISQRSNDLLLCSIKFLHEPSIYSLLPSTKRFIFDVYSRLYAENVKPTEMNELLPRQSKLISLAKCRDEDCVIVDEVQKEPMATLPELDEVTSHKTFKNKLEQRLSNMQSSMKEAEHYDGAINSDIEILRKTYHRSDRLSMLFNVLNSVPLTTIEAERAFSCAGRLKTKIRNKLGDDTLDSIMVLRNNRKYLFPK